MYQQLKQKPAVRQWVRSLTLRRRRLVVRCYKAWVHTTAGWRRTWASAFPFDFHALAADMGEVIIEEPVLLD